MTGRITEYNKKVPASIREYIDERVADDRIPTISGLCKKINRSRSTIYSWKDKYVEVADLIEEILESQEEMLIDHGLSGKYNPSITKLLLTHHGYSDKQEINANVTVKEASELTDKELESIAAGSS